MNKNISHTPTPESMYPQSAFQEICEAIHLMELAFRLQKGFHDKLIDETCFTKRIIVDTPQGFGVGECELDKSALALRFYNLVFSTMGTLAIAVDNALDKTYGTKKPQETDTINSLRNFFYMLRCAYAHDAMNPTWEIKTKYKRTYKVIIPVVALQKFKQLKPKTEYEFDFEKLNGEIVEFDYFDRFNGLMCLALYAAHLTEPI